MSSFIVQSNPLTSEHKPAAGWYTFCLLRLRQHIPWKVGTFLPVHVPEDQNINICCYENIICISYFVMILLCNVTVYGGNNLCSSAHAFIVFWCLTFRHCVSSVLGQAFCYSPENAFYIFNQQIYFII